MFNKANKEATMKWKVGNFELEATNTKRGRDVIWSLFHCGDYQGTVYREQIPASYRFVSKADSRFSNFEVQGTRDALIRKLEALDG